MSALSALTAYTLPCSTSMKLIYFFICPDTTDTYGHIMQQGQRGLFFEQVETFFFWSVWSYMGVKICEEMVTPSIWVFNLVSFNVSDSLCPFLNIHSFNKKIIR